MSDGEENQINDTSNGETYLIPDDDMRMKNAS